MFVIPPHRTPTNRPDRLLGTPQDLLDLAQGNQHSGPATTAGRSKRSSADELVSPDARFPEQPGGLGRRHEALRADVLGAASKAECDPLYQAGRIGPKEFPEPQAWRSLAFECYFGRSTPAAR